MILTPNPTTHCLTVTMQEESLSPEELAAANARRAKFKKNMEWFEAHVGDIRQHHSGKYICVAGESLFSGDDPKELYSQGKAAFPADWGAFFTMYLRPLPQV